VAPGNSVADIFQEVDDEVRREQFKKLWDRYGSYVVAAAILVIAAIAAWRGYQWWEAKKAAGNGAAFEAAASLAESGKHNEAEAAFARIAAQGTSGYRGLARIREAAALAQIDRKAAVAAYEKMAGDSTLDPTLRDVAGLRAAAILIDEGAFAEARSRLEPLAGNESTFRHTARELLVLAAWRAGDSATAKRWADMIMTDAQTPAATRSRIEMLIALGATASKS
jgi:hypothetical protein